ncbi:MAG: alanine--tRNA ligase [Candidatus Omnitrophota bacterium]
MKNLTTNALRKLYLDFFVAKGHNLVKSDSLVPANDPSVLFTSAGMNQFKDYFLGRRKGLQRATSCQKCFRTGDLEQVGLTPFHHTFFEMLGNFSFGGYFKKEAIEWAWEFVTRALEIDPGSLWVSVYEDDGEALNIWKDHIRLPPDKIKSFGQKDNFWPSNAIKDGPNGPCGPCSEIYYQKEGGESVEVWNLVFTQFDRRDNGVLEPLPNKNIDTGMGIERMASVLQGVDSNFKIDIFSPIVEAVKNAVELSEERPVNMIADHVRAVVFCIADGVLPSNDGRGYVVRKLIRRCAYMNPSKDPKPFLYKIVSSVADAMSEPYPEVLERRDNIAQIIKAEEEKYIKNILEGGSERLNAIIEGLKREGSKVLPAEVGVDLYETYGILPDFTIECSAKAGLTVDKDKMNALFKEAQDRTRAKSKMAGNIFNKGAVSLKNSEFTGYDMDSCEAKVIQLIKDGKEVNEALVGENINVVLDKTPFYGESGGQVGDRGVIVGSDTGFKLVVTDTKKQDGSIVHLGEVSGHGRKIRVNDAVMASVDPQHRQAIKRAHTATHILQAVLRKVLGPHVQQAGSLVEPDRFRFDFTHFKDIGEEEMDAVQELLNDYVLRNDKLIAQQMPKSEALKTGAIALFGEKYEDMVRVVSIADYSKEFCGGTHLDATGSIGLVLITSESSVGSGLRRIEALTGKLAYKRSMNTLTALEEASLALKTRPDGIIPALGQYLERQKALERELSMLRENELKNDIDSIAGKADMIKGVALIIHKFKNFDVDLLRKAVDLLKTKFSAAGVFVLSSVSGENAYFVCGVTPDLVKRGLCADELIKNVLPLAGGSGGGRKDFAQGGTKEISKVDSAMKDIERLIRIKI